MTDHNAPNAPESLPNYLADGVPKQKIATLEALREYIDETIEHKRRPVPSSELPDNAERVEDSDDNSTKGTVYVRKQKCGDDTCHCNDGELHGPYKYRAWRDDKGNVKQKYVGKA